MYLENKLLQLVCTVKKSCQKRKLFIFSFNNFLLLILIDIITTVTSLFLILSVTFDLLPVNKLPEWPFYLLPISLHQLPLNNKLIPATNHKLGNKKLSVTCNLLPVVSVVPSALVPLVAMLAACSRALTDR